MLSPTNERSPVVGLDAEYSSVGTDPAGPSHPHSPPISLETKAVSSDPANGIWWHWFLKSCQSSFWYFLTSKSMVTVVSSLPMYLMTDSEVQPLDSFGMGIISTLKGSYQYWAFPPCPGPGPTHFGTLGSDCEALKVRVTGQLIHRSWPHLLEPWAVPLIKTWVKTPFFIV